MDQEETQKKVLPIQEREKGKLKMIIFVNTICKNDGSKNGNDLYRFGRCKRTNA